MCVVVVVVVVGCGGGGGGGGGLSGTKPSRSHPLPTSAVPTPQFPKSSPAAVASSFLCVRFSELLCLHFPDLSLS